MAHRTIPPSASAPDPRRPTAGRPGAVVLLDRLRAAAIPARLPAVLAVLAAAGVGWWLLRPAPPPTEATLPLAPAAASAAGGATRPPSTVGGDVSSTTAPAVVVQAAGQVVSPGVYRLAAGSRVDDLVREAGGFGPRADRDRVNLAAELVDGARVWVPAVGEEAPPVVVSAEGGSSSGAPPGSASGTAPPQPVDLNTATAEELDALPGVGPATAAAILAYRDQHGPFAAVDDLLEVRGIGDAKLEQLRPLVHT